MGNKAENMINQIELRCGSEYLHKLYGQVKAPAGKSTPKRQGEFISTAIRNIRADFGVQTVKAVMRPCGYSCISVSTLRNARKLWRSAEGDQARYIELLNESGIGGGRFRFEDGVIYGILDKCVCSVAKSAKNLPEEYCECSAGWYEKLFSETTGMEVSVTALKTILRGDERCEFRIELS